MDVLLVWCRRPAGEQVQRLFRLRPRVSGVDEHREAGIGHELHRLEREAQLADGRVVEALEPGVVSADVVGGPEGSKQLAARRQLADEVGEVAVVWIATGFRAQYSHDVVRDALPVGVESGGARIEEDDRAVFGGCAVLSKCPE
jgi:hypothetical protein